MAPSQFIREIGIKEITGIAIFLITLGISIGYYKHTIDAFDKVTNKIDSMNDAIEAVKISNARLEERIEILYISNAPVPARTQKSSQLKN